MRLQGSACLWRVFFCRSLATSSPTAAFSPDNRAMSTPKPFSDIPGLKGLPIVGNVPKIIRSRKKGNAGDDSVLHELHSKLGPIYKLKMLGNRWSVVTCSPEDAQAVARAEGKYPSRGIFENNMKWIYTKIDTPIPMFFSGGEEWKRIRSAAAKQVMPRRVGNFADPLCDIVDEFLSHLNKNIMDGSGNVSDIVPELAKWAFQGVSYFVYGEKIDIYSGSDPKQKEFIEAGLDYIQSLGMIASALPLYQLFPTKPYRDYVRIVRRMQAAGNEVLRQRYEEIKKTDYVDETKAVGLLDQWLIEGKYTEEEALSQSYDMLSAGIDTTKNSSAFLLFEIAKQPQLQDRMVNEIYEVVGEKENPSWNDLQRMSLIRNCIKETLRLYVPTGVFTRKLNEDAVLSGYRVPAGTGILFTMHTASRDDKVFQDPEEFRPDRWDREGSDNIHPFSSLPFGFGPRACYGRRLAELEMYLLLSKLLPRYHIATNIKDMKLKQKVVISPDIPLHIKFDKRS